MSLTCVHSVADARNHPECPGCRVIPNSEVRAAQRWDAMSDDERRAVMARGVAIAVRTRTGQTLAQRDGRGPLLESGDPTAERAAYDTPERPGTWFGDPHADGRELTQDETDQLVRSELWGLATLTELLDPELEGTLGDHRYLRMTLARDHADFSAGRAREVFQTRATRQRGGVCSDPLVRVLAWRAWGDRDLRWRETRGVRKGDLVDQVGDDLVVVRSRDGGAVAAGFALADGLPGQTVLCQLNRVRRPLGSPVRGLVQTVGAPVIGVPVARVEGIVEARCRVGDRPRVAPESYHSLLLR